MPKDHIRQTRATKTARFKHSLLRYLLPDRHQITGYASSFGTVFGLL